MMKIPGGYKSLAAATIFATATFSASPGFAAWELIVRTGFADYQASFSNQCPPRSTACAALTMCGKRVYISGAQRVLESYKRGHEVILFRKGGTIQNALCRAKRR